MTDQKSEADKAREHEDTMARVKARAEAFARSPFWFTLWDISHKCLSVVFWLLFWSLVTQCTCGGCVW
jgi:hypothetical protein